jgi:hypothetical protein
MGTRTLFEAGTHRNILLEDFGRGLAVQANQHLIIDGTEGIILDPGGHKVYGRASAEAFSVLGRSRLRYLFLSHQDPDIVAAANGWLMTTDADAYDLGPVDPLHPALRPRSNSSPIACKSDPRRGHVPEARFLRADGSARALPPLRRATSRSTIARWRRSSIRATSAPLIGQRLRRRHRLRRAPALHGRVPSSVHGVEPDPERLGADGPRLSISRPSPRSTAR